MAANPIAAVMGAVLLIGGAGKFSVLGFRVQVRV
jgi:hypothetical protein